MQHSKGLFVYAYKRIVDETKRYFAHLLTRCGVLEQLLVSCMLLLCMRLMRAKLIGAEL